MTCNAAWSMLYPYNFITNYGGRYQFNTIDTTQYTPQEAYAMRNVGNPFYQVNTLCQGIAASNCPDSGSIYAAQAGAAAGAQAAVESFNKIDMQITAGEISGLKSQLDQALTSDQLTPAQKDELRALRRKVEALQDRMTDIALLQQNGATAEQIKTALTLIRNDYRVLRDEIQGTADRIQAELVAALEAAAAAEAEAAAAAAAAEEGAEEGSEEASEEGSEEGAEEELIEGWGTVDTTTFNPDMYSANIDDDSISTIADEIYTKVDGAGSGNVAQYIKDNINKDNVVEVILHWNKHYAEGYAEADALGFSETIMDESLLCGCNDIEPVIEAMQSRLADLKDIDKETYGVAKTQLSIARAECDAVWCDEDKVSNAFNKAHAALVELELAKAAKEQQEAQAA